MSTPISEEYYPPEPKNHGSMPFRYFVAFLDRLQSEKPTPSQRKDIIIELCGIWRKKCGNNIFPCFRLLLPDKDIARIFQLKEKKLAAELVKILRVDPKSADGKAMLKWKDGSMAGVGDFARRCRENIVKRYGKRDYSDLNLDQVNELLDELAVANDRKGAQRIVLERMVRLMNAHEMYWIIKIIIKSMKIRMTEKSVLDCWHSSASKLFNVTSDLRRVCWELYNETVTVCTSDVQPFLCFKPQMANFAMKDYGELISKIGSKSFYIEEKIDGERLQIHMKEGEFRYYSRAGNDKTEKYGKNYEDTRGSFTSLIKGFVSDKVKSIILDGEIVSWNEVEGMVEGFSRIKGATIMLKDLGDIVGVKGNSFSRRWNNEDDFEANDANDFRNSSNQDNAVLSKWKQAVETVGGLPHRHGYYIIYDLVYLNGLSLLSFPLRERRRVLNAIINPIEHVIKVIDFTEGTTKDDIDKRFLEVMEKDGEGLVVKNPDASYGLNVRDNSWVKVKPEYIDNLGENLDLLIIGGYYGNGARAGGLSSFLCGIRNSDKEEEDGPVDGSDENIPPYYSFCKVGGGFTSEEYGVIRTMFKGKTTPYHPGDRMPSCIDMGNQVPDVWIHPRDSIVIQIKAGQVTVTSNYKSNLTLRFPRFYGFRHDKDWRTASSLSQLRKIQSDLVAKRKLQQRELQKSKLAAKKRGAGTKRLKLEIVTTKEDSKKYGGKKISNLFEDTQFYILTSQRIPDFMSQQELEILIQQHGGRVITEFTSETLQKYLQQNTLKSHKKIRVVADLSTVSVSKFSEKYQSQVTIIRPSWIQMCISQTRIIPLEPKHLFFLSGEESYLARCLVDRYGDNYYEPSEIDGFKTVLDRIVPSKLELRNNEVEFHSTLQGFATTFDQLFHTEATPLSMLFAMNIIYFDFQEQTLKHIPDANNYISSSNGSISYSPWMPSGASRKLDAQLELIKARSYAKYGGAVIAENPFNSEINVVVCSSKDPARVSELRKRVMLNPLNNKRVHFVNAFWIFDCWKERTKLPEENFPARTIVDYSY